MRPNLLLIAVAVLASTACTSEARHIRSRELKEKNDRTFHPVDQFHVRRLDEDRVHVDVRASDDIHVSHELSRVRNLYAVGSTIHIAQPEGEVVMPMENRHAKYTYHAKHEYGWFTCSYHPDEDIIELIVRNGTKTVQVGHRNMFLKDEGARILAEVPDSEFWYEVDEAHDNIFKKYDSERHLSSDDSDDEDPDCLAWEVPESIVAKSSDLNDLEILLGDDSETASAMGVSGYTISTLAKKVKLPKKSTNATTSSVEDHSMRRQLTDDYAFTPDCYTDDDRAHQIAINIVSDVAFYTSVGGTNASVLAQYEKVFTQSSAIYEIQMNMQLSISNMWMATDSAVPSSWPTFFSYSTDDSTCPLDISGQLNSATSFTRSLASSKQAATLHYFTGCPSGSSTTGVAWIGTLCNNNYNAGISRYTSSLWRTFAHELGHNFAAVHSFENGVGTTGGIMDYGNGKILGTNLYRFRLARRDEMCGELQSAITASCEYITIYEEETTCGNEIISGDEECECVGGGTSCTGCKNCALTKDVECSTSTFYMVAQGSATTYGTLSDSSCCVDGVLMDADTECDGGYCSAGGQCLDPCSASSSLESCGVSNQGCRIKCTDGSTCSANWKMSGAYIGNVVDGSICTTSAGGEGVCSSGTCVYTGPPTDRPTPSPTPPTPQPTARPTREPTPQPTKTPTAQPTKKPTNQPTTKPTKAPTDFPTARPTKAPTPEPTAKPTKAPTPAPTKVKALSFSSKLCKLNKSCSTSEPGVVRFGNKNAYAFYYFDDAADFDCSTDVFGFDPLPNKKKFCWFYPTALDFSKLGNEGATRTVKKAGMVRFGADGDYVFKTYDGSTSIKCEAAEFNDVDPAPSSSSKQCYVAYF